MWTHLRRALDWNVRSIVLSPWERQHLDAAGIMEPRLQALLAWRRSALLVVLPILILAVILSGFDQIDHLSNSKLSGEDTRSGELLHGSLFTGFGYLVLWLQPIGLLLVPIGAGYALWKWTNFRRSFRMLVICWAGSVAIPLLIALMPLNWVIDVDLVRGLGDQSTVFGVRLAYALRDTTFLLPVLVSIAGGVLRGAARAKSLLPTASLPGWFLVAVAPFYSVIVIVVFVLFEQLLGNALLMLGVGLLAASPWVYVYYRKLYARPLSNQVASAQLARASRIGGLVSLAGLVFVFLWILTAKVEGTAVVGSSKSDMDGAFLTYLDVLRTVVEVFARSTVTAVVICVLFLNMVFHEWRALAEMEPELRAEYDADRNLLSRYEAGQKTGIYQIPKGH